MQGTGYLRQLDSETILDKVMNYRSRRKEDLAPGHRKIAPKLSLHHQLPSSSLGPRFWMPFPIPHAQNPFWGLLVL